MTKNAMTAKVVAVGCRFGKPPAGGDNRDAGSGSPQCGLEAALGGVPLGNWKVLSTGPKLEDSEFGIRFPSRHLFHPKNLRF